MCDKEIFILRHGETDWNVQGRLNSTTDLALNSHGLSQAEQAGLVLRSRPVDAVIASPARRAMETMEAVTLKLQKGGCKSPSIKVDDRLREIDFGSLEGLTQQEMRDSGLWEAFMAWRAEDHQVSPPGAETLSSAEERAMSIFSEVVALPHSAVLLISHGHFSRIMLSKCVLGSNALFHRRLRFDNGQLAHIKWESGKPRLVSFNSLVLGK